ncbi:uncharacterized protein JCM15063_001490 [Sporobolomyces koalae]|uniref:uncharacterized protein n=1 Tax=Sporobolomyces koalae TaxID=500713 RepID=UPI0031802B34
MPPASLPEVDDPLDFTHRSFQQVDSALRCQICHELLTAPVLLTTCSHTFDSLCLRTHLKDIKKCPQCATEANEDRIRRNIQLEQVVQLWKLARTDLLALERVPTPPVRESNASTTTSSVKTKRKRSPSPQPAAYTIPDDESSDIEVISEDPAFPNKMSRPNKAAASTKGKEKQARVGGDPTDPSLLVNCPLCSNQVKNGLISGHIDSQCKRFIHTAPTLDERGHLALTRSHVAMIYPTDRTDEDTPHVGSGHSSHDLSKYLPLPNYAHKKLKDLEIILRELDLPTTIPTQPSHAPMTTDHKIQYLKKRHSHFLTLWNANVDVTDETKRKSSKQLKDELRNWERVFEREDKDKEKRSRTKGSNQTSQGTEVEFKNLIEQARATYKRDREKKVSTQAPELAVADEKEEDSASNSRDEKVELEEKRGTAEPSDRIDEAESTMKEEVEEEHETPLERTREEESEPRIEPAADEILWNGVERTQPNHSHSPPPTTSIPTPPRLHSFELEEAENEGGRYGRRTRERSSSILEYDQKFFPPTSQRVRQIDWDLIRKVARQDEQETEHDLE